MSKIPGDLHLRPLVDVSPCVLRVPLPRSASPLLPPMVLDIENRYFQIQDIISRYLTIDISRHSQIYLDRPIKYAHIKTFFQEDWPHQTQIECRYSNCLNISKFSLIYKDIFTQICRCNVDSIYQLDNSCGCDLCGHCATAAGEEAGALHNYIIR